MILGLYSDNSSPAETMLETACMRRICGHDLSVQCLGSGAEVHASSKFNHERFKLDKLGHNRHHQYLMVYGCFPPHPHAEGWDSLGPQMSPYDSDSGLA